MTLWSRAQDVSDEARLLLADGRANGAASRGYYAMVFAARAVLERVDPAAAAAKKHGTLIGQFARQMVRARGLDPALGRAFNAAHDLRLVADYAVEGVHPDDATRLVANMERFIVALDQADKTLP